MDEPFEDLTGEQKAIEILRWFAVLPAALLGGLVAQVVTRIAYTPEWTRGAINPDYSVIDKFFVVLMSNAIIGAATVVVGAKTAPRHKRVVAVVLAVLLIFLSGMTFTVLILGPVQLWDIMAIVVQAGAAVGGVQYVFAEDKE